MLSSDIVLKDHVNNENLLLLEEIGSLPPPKAVGIELLGFPHCLERGLSLLGMSQ